VVVGSSAGGIEALLSLISSLPQDFPAPVILAQHLNPKRPSILGKLLRARASLPVEVLQSSSPLKPGEIYVVPSNYHVQVRDGWVELQEDQAGRPKPSINRLFNSAALAYGDHLIAVILTGIGSDGATGASEVKREGGTIIIQNPNTAAFSGMPQSVSAEVVDYRLNLEEIGPLLCSLLSPNDNLPSAKAINS
jgi:two-component system CheB/CheR fusion protein